MRRKHLFFISIFLILLNSQQLCMAQFGVPIKLEKPKEYEERVLRSEKSQDKKLKLPTRFIQNTVTHYNYFFNANNILNDIVDRAKISFKEDYSKLLPFYNYDLGVTAGDSIKLDSIIYKASSGIALHDLRGDWVDNLYLLWGQSFYLQQKFDSAYLMFQFVNYAFAEKEKDGYYKTIGSIKDGNSALSISTKEKTSIPRNLFSEPPSRNDAFIWQIKNFLVQDKFAEAATLIETLKKDPVFPSRLSNDLNEVQALLYYKQNRWDSAASYLVEALSTAGTKQEKARWEYLAAQLYERAGNNIEAENLYAKVSGHTTDLVLDIYARLASIRVNKDGGEKAIEKNIAELLKMARRDRYEEYRDIIYFMAAQMQLETGDTDAALALLLKSTQYSSNSISQRNKAFLQLGDLSFAKKRYRPAFNFYDSLNVNDPEITNIAAINQRKDIAGLLARNLEVINRQDSLQRIANMPEDERKDFIKKLVRQLRKRQGLKDEGTTTALKPFSTQNNDPGLFPTANQKGEWYFYNSASRSRGNFEFKAKWGARPNLDNWRRNASQVGGVNKIVTNNNQRGNLPTSDSSTTADDSNEITYDALFNKLPLSPAQIKKSNDSINNASFVLGKALIQQVEDCPAGTEMLEKLRTQSPDFQPMDELLFNLYYCYNKNSDLSKAESIKKLMGKQYDASNYTAIVSTGKNPEDKLANTEATKAYEDIYDLFVEGKFAEAIEQKNLADSIYGDSYWTPQLLYIEAVYHIKQREDSTATTLLNSIINQFANTPIAKKASGLVEVLSKRKQIEDELTKMDITRHPTDSLQRIEPITPIAPVTVKTPSKPDSVGKTPVKVIPTLSPALPKVVDTVSVKTKKVSGSYTYNPIAKQVVILVLNKVDPVFSTEAKNAFFRYNRENYYNKTFTMDLQQLDDENRLLLIAPFANSQEAVEYVDKALPKTATEIIPWLKGGKYNFIIISEDNYELLKENKDLGAYKQFLNQYYPGKF